MSRVNILIVDKEMNTLEVNIPKFMLEQINYDSALLKKHADKKSLNAEITSFLKK